MKALAAADAIGVEICKCMYSVYVVRRVGNFQSRDTWHCGGIKSEPVRIAHAYLRM